MSWCNKGGSVFLIGFKTVQARPLRERRTWCPRMSRGGSADCPRNISRSWTWHRPVLGLDSAGNRTWTGTFRVRAQSTTALSPRPQSRPRIIHVRAQATAAIVREQAAAMDADCPQPVRSRELSTSANWSHPQSVREHGVAQRCPHRRIALSILPPIHFPIHVRIIPSHDLI
jgi:hypothetical protein